MSSVIVGRPTSFPKLLLNCDLPQPGGDRTARHAPCARAILPRCRSARTQNDLRASGPPSSANDAWPRCSCRPPLFLSVWHFSCQIV